MIYQSQKMRLECIRIVKTGEVNDIYICQDLNTAARTQYTLLAVKQHETVKKYLKIFEAAGLAAQNACVESFTDQGVFCIVFEYKQERPLKDFYMGESYSLTECENICMQVITSCISSGLPYPVLYLVLEQGQLNISKDTSIYLGYQIDLAQLDPSRTEGDCVVLCAELLRGMLESKASRRTFSYQLLEKKVARKSYVRFTELYRDIHITASSKKKAGLRKKLRAWFNRNQDTLFRILLAVSIVMGLFVVVSVASQLFFGDTPWFRIFFNGFKHIGTESLVR